MLINQNFNFKLAGFYKIYIYYKLLLFSVTKNLNILLRILVIFWNIRNLIAQYLCVFLNIFEYFC